MNDTETYLEIRKTNGQLEFAFVTPTTNRRILTAITGIEQQLLDMGKPLIIHPGDARADNFLALIKEAY